MAYLPIYVFAVVYGAAALAWQLPFAVAGGYAVASLTCFVAYRIDKSAARGGQWRTPEATLLLLGLIGGWPGALLAQQWLRHKTAKRSFQWKFRISIFVNTFLFLYFAYQYGGSASI
jgi:uncharacterized membrane protein YsdA (DUF1294 family)